MGSRQRKMIVDARLALHLKDASLSKETSKLYFGKMNNGVLSTYYLFHDISLSGVISVVWMQHPKTCFLPNAKTGTK